MVVISNQVFRAMHLIYSSAGKMSIYPVVFNLMCLLSMYDDCGLNQKQTIMAIDFWLNSIARNSNGAPVLLIATHKDKVVSGADLTKGNADLAASNEEIKRANAILADHIKGMKVFQSKLLNLHFPKQPSSLHVLCAAVPIFCSLHSLFTFICRWNRRGQPGLLVLCC